MKVLLATGNQAKKERYGNLLRDIGYEVISLKDINLKLEVDENGDNPLENAIIKATAYYKATQIPTIAQDDGLFIDKFPVEKQPGTHVRRVGGRELTDDEALKYYTEELKKVGGESRAVWKRGLAFVNDTGQVYSLETEDEIHFVSKPCEIISKGYPLSSIGFVKARNKYTVELSAEEAEEEYKEYYTKIREFFKRI
ncbi:MAG TPA: hypothetical protein DCP90_07740 [Clostridiales bacterium]|nr:MAG: hypothetical protein A2Y22_01305 [Clostridiales bacterium GWD2_32_59]HAN10490.1 hypothetical protein [Clostridiales bacterium]